MGIFKGEPGTSNFFVVLYSPFGQRGVSRRTTTFFGCSL